MKEGNSKFEKSEKSGREIADNALIGIENAWEVVEDLGYPAEAHDSFRTVAEHLKKHAYYFGKALFDEARNSTSKERLKYVRGFKKMLAILAIVGVEEKDKLLKDLMTNSGAIKELEQRAFGEIGAERKERRRQKMKSIVSIFKKNSDDKK
ncbi:MAG: hypothetical protein HYT98_05355 [Candidatus Sungbacteria bacterium]|nr:hypothetical protein [Candidatus Sungbacteria bacterium]